MSSGLLNVLVVPGGLMVCAFRHQPTSLPPTTRSPPTCRAQTAATNSRGQDLSLKVLTFSPCTQRARQRSPSRPPRSRRYLRALVLYREHKELFPRKLSAPRQASGGACAGASERVWV